MSSTQHNAVCEAIVRYALSEYQEFASENPDRFLVRSVRHRMLLRLIEGSVAFHSRALGLAADDKQARMTLVETLAEQAVAQTTMRRSATV